jgi:hypothetical protein
MIDFKIKKMIKMNKESNTTAPAIDANTVLATGLYCIKVQANHDCRIADWDGDPGRTLVIKYAKKFKRKSEAEKLCKELKVKYPNRNFWVDVF